jgi:6-methylsalicylate decarboxylase
VSAPATTSASGVKACLRQLYYDPAISTSPHAVASLLQLANPEHILFGSDYPALCEDDIQSLIPALDDQFQGV